ncbi:MAG: T9SS type A sorting domain-containing protein [Bacteroidia bacterium]
MCRVILFLFTYLFTDVVAFGQCNWQALGADEINEPDFGMGYANYCDYGVYSIAKDGTYYTAQSSTLGIFVRKFDGVNWVTVGQPYFAKTYINAFFAIYTDNNSVPFVVFTDTLVTNNLIVMKFDGTNWINVGARDFSSPIYFSHAGEFKAYIRFDKTNTPYVGYTDGNRIYCSKFNGTDWDSIGPPALYSSSSSLEKVFDFQIDQNDAPLIAYSTGLSLSIYKYNGSTWNNYTSVGGFSTNAQYLSLEIDSINNIYLSCNHGVFKFNGISWTTLPSPGSGYRYDMGLTNGYPVILYSDRYSVSNKMIIKKYTGSSWVGMDTIVANAKYISPFLDKGEILIDNSGGVYISDMGTLLKYDGVSDFNEIGLLNWQFASRDMQVSKQGKIFSLDDGLTVYEGGQWIFKYPTDTLEEFAIDTSGLPYFAHLNHADSILTVKMFNGIQWIQLGDLSSYKIGDNLPNVNLKINKNNIPYLVITGDENMAFKYDVMSDTWIPVGSVGLKPAGFASGTAEMSDMQFDYYGNPVVAIRAGDTVRIIRSVNDTAWQYAYYLYPQNVTNTQGLLKFELFSDGINEVPYLVYQNSLNYLIVYKRTQNGWQTVGTPLQSLPSLVSDQPVHCIAVNRNETVYMNTVDNSRNLVLSVLNGNNWISSTVSGFRMYATAGSITLDTNGVPVIGYSSGRFHAREMIGGSLINILTQPASMAMCTNSASSFVVSASGGFVYQWQVDSFGIYTNLLNNTIYSGVNSPSLTLTNPSMYLNNHQYRCVITSACGNYTYSNAATLALLTVPSINVTASSSSFCKGDSAVLQVTGANTYTWMPGGSNSYTNTISPASSTVYTVTGVGVNGCTGTSIIPVIVHQLPIVNINATHTFVCVGDTSQLSVAAVSGGIYSWQPSGQSTNSIKVAPSSTTIYTASVKDTYGCVGVDTLDVVVSNNPLPNVSISPTNTILCKGTTTTLTANGASQYQWTPGNLNSVSIAISPTVSTTYSVTGTDGNGCFQGAVISINVVPLPTVTISQTNSVICLGTNDTLSAHGALTYTWDYGTITTPTMVVSPLNNSTYSVVGTDANGCFKEATINMIVKPLPNVGAFVNNVCLGSSTTLQATGALTYTWQPGNLTTTSILVTPTVTTTYTLSGTDANGCKKTVNVPVTVYNPPNVSLSLGYPNPLCTSAGPQTLSGGSPSGGVYSGAGISSNHFNPSMTGPGTFAVYYDYMDSHNCSGTATDTVHVSSCVGIEQYGYTSAISVTPNPSNGIFNLSGITLEGFNMEIYNGRGEMIIKKDNLLSSEKIDLSNQSNGMYYLKVKDSSANSIYQRVLLLKQ